MNSFNRLLVCSFWGDLGEVAVGVPFVQQKRQRFINAAVAALAGVVYTSIENGASNLTSATGSYLGTKGPTDS